ncbi:hypothetical protein X975_02504, partial [Stegodyphus mimosarum]
MSVLRYDTSRELNQPHLTLVKIVLVWPLKSCCRKPPETDATNTTEGSLELNFNPKTEP